MMYRYRCKSEVLKFNSYLNELKQFDEIEYYNARVKNTTVYHLTKWSVYRDKFYVYDFNKEAEESIDTFVQSYLDRL